jgi:hypothetical protein
MKTRINLILLFLSLGIYTLQAQIQAQTQLSSNAISIANERNFDRIINTEFTTEELGSPELPVSYQSYVIPVDASNVQLTVQNVSKQKLIGQYTIFPVQPPVPVGTTDSIPFIAPKQSIYGSGSPFPGKYAEIVSDIWLFTNYNPFSFFCSSHSFNNFIVN